ncbi:hypothetical protein HK105_207222 [Polyrhizophydium stewartii]|uniref:F-box/LRR-repeat protein 15-like leucin rich repeat domain-containing protein n=1 Tax=Polyrhizophydium stewartii TaxID=2732419 RepID=A0ABR4N131_9FUNG
MSLPAAEPASVSLEAPALSAAAATTAASVSAGSGAASGWQTPAPTPPATPASHAPPPAPAAPLRQVRIIPDVLPEIFKFLVDATETLHSCALVRHTWRNVVLAVLYARPHFASVWSLRRFTAALARRACLGRWVRQLDLSTIRTTIPPAEFARLFPLVSGVRSVDLSYCRELRDCHVQTLLAQCAQTLTAITLAGNKHLTNTSLELIAAHAGVRLRALCIDECHGITDACMQVVASKCTQLVTLKLASTGSLITDASLLALAWPRRARACDSLRTIQLYSCPGVTDASLTLLAQVCPHLAAVELYRLPWVTDMSLAEMARHSGSSLRSLCLGEMPNITDTSICEIGRSCDMHSLTLCHCEHITDRGIVELVRHSPSIGFLDIGLVGDITLVSLVATAQCCPRLQDLVVVERNSTLT